MSDEEELTPQDSKCYTCKYGMVLHDLDRQMFVQPHHAEENPFDENSGGNQDGIANILIDVDKIRSACFWRLAYTGQATAPLIFNVVKDCSRYEANS